tara:strand:+ start:1381 stop:1485 length:105 start_codon:yes stop_codon:yes gene_type:complete
MNNSAIGIKIFGIPPLLLGAMLIKKDEWIVPKWI